MLKIALVNLRATCGRHPHYNPEDGQAAVKGACPRCLQLLSIYQTHQQLTAQLHNLRNVKHDKPNRPAKEQPESRQIPLF